MRAATRRFFAVTLRPVPPGDVMIYDLAGMDLNGAEHVSTVLVVDDNAENRALAEAILVDEGYVVRDLKNPVNSVDLQAQLLERIPDLPPKARRSIARIRDEARMQLRLILNLLDISKSEEGRLAPVKAPIDLEALMAEVVAALELRASDCGVTLATSLAIASAHADADLLRRVLENLVENAIRHAPEQSVVRVTAAAHDRGVLVRIADAGQGVPEAAREKVFERFVQLGADDSQSTRVGRGLGLTFCKLAVEAHGGRIWVEDADPGAVFCLLLPGEVG